MTRFIQGLILVNIAIVAITTIVQYTRDSVHATAGSPFRSALLDLVALSITFIAVSLIVLVRFEGDPAWLLVPVGFLIPLSFTGIYLALTSGGEVGPAVARPLFVLGYLTGYFVLRSASQSARRNPGRASATP
ncbi:MAG: hypothetical protein ABR573_11865 [Candidatus Dormibacteria bacterium]